MRPRLPVWLLVVVVLATVSNALRAQRVTGDIAGAMRRVADYAERYYSTAQSILATETVTVQNVGRDLLGAGFPRRFVYNLRVEWTPAADGPPTATLSRELVSVNGRPPREGDEPHCTAPKPITPEPLAMFLMQRQSDFIFSGAERTRDGGQSLLRVDYRLRQPEADVVSWDRECVTMNFPARLRGRVWFNESTGEVMRIDEGAQGPLEVVGPRQPRTSSLPVVLFERWNVSIRYRAVTFEDPAETLLLPASIDGLTMARNGGTRRTQVYSNYRRFVTGGRVIE